MWHKYAKHDPNYKVELFHAKEGLKKKHRDLIFENDKILESGKIGHFAKTMGKNTGKLGMYEKLL